LVLLALLALLILLVLLRSLVRDVAACHATCDGAEHCVMRSVAGDPADHRALMHYTAINLRFPTSGNLPFSH
jgi:hypothetical protein